MRKILLTSIFLHLVFILVAEEKPNVVVFMVDDLRTDLGCYGNTVVQSPNIDALAADGVLFSNAYTQQAICAPSRMSMLTGLRPETLEIYSIFTKLRKVHSYNDVVSMPQYFQNNGYTTVSVGKVYHHATDDLKSWTIHHKKENNAWITPHSIEIIDSLKQNNIKGNGPAYECADVDDDGYKDGRAATKAIETLRQVKDDPFLMFVGLSKPHLPFNAPKKYWDLYKTEEMIVPDRTVPKGMANLALTKWGELRNYDGIPKEGMLDDETTRTLRHGYYACVSYIDAQVGRVMAELEKLNLRENTMVILISDHGWKLGEYGAWCKHTNFELDVNVPLIISRETSHAKRTTGKTCDALVENVDLFQTAAQFCGFNTDSLNLEGKNILPLTDKPNLKWSKASYSVYARGDKYMGITCTNGKWRYTEWRNSITQEVLDRELYNHTKSPLAIENVSGEAKYLKLENEMKELLYLKFPTDRKPFYTK